MAVRVRVHARARAHSLCACARACACACACVSVLACSYLRARVRACVLVRVCEGGTASTKSALFRMHAGGGEGRIRWGHAGDSGPWVTNTRAHAAASVPRTGRLC
eukprot:15470391-Alexandrium_andersonii.AAC.1